MGQLNRLPGKAQMYDLTILIPTIITIIVTVTLSNWSNRESTMKAINEWRSETRADQSAMKTSIDNLTKSVDRHNHFAERMPVVEQQVSDLRRDADEIYGRLRKVEMGVNKNG